MINNGYSICYNDWLFDKRIKNELGLLIEINSLCYKQGYCYATNKYLADLFGESEISISRKISKLQKLGYLQIKYKKAGATITSREMQPLTKLLTAINKNVNGTVNQNVKQSNISNSNNNIRNGNRYYSGEIIDLEKYYINLEV